MKEQLTEAEKRELDQAREDRRTRQPYASEVDDREIEQGKTVAPREGSAKPRAK